MYAREPCRASESILDGLTAIARSAWPFAVAWHVTIALALLALVRGWRPTQRSAALLLCAPISVSVFAAIHANPFRSRAWSTTLAAMGLFYGVFGALKLGVMIDITLTAGALVLLAASWRQLNRRARPRTLERE